VMLALSTGMWIFLSPYDTQLSWVNIWCSLVNLTWVGSCIHFSVQVFLALKLPFCGPTVFYHFFYKTKALFNLPEWTLMLSIHWWWLIVGSNAWWIS
jgi:hypothetical protein